MSLRLSFIFLILVLVAPSAYAAEAGFQRGRTAAGTEIGIWYPAEGKAVRQRFGLYAADVVPDAAVPDGPRPLVVISHGTGGDYASHVDTAVALARAGFVVAALTHPGDNWRDNSRATRIEERPPAVSALVTHMLTVWTGRAAIDPRRIGAFGFSAGGFTVLAAVGGRPNLTRMASHCAANPAFFDCTLMTAQPRASLVPRWPDIRDRRIRAVVLAAPALGFVFDRSGLANVRVPVQLWRADDDHILPAPHYADSVRRALPVSPEFHAVPGAGHFDFLAPCIDPLAMSPICASVPGFDRAAFHVRLNAEVVRFLTARLGSSRRR